MKKLALSALALLAALAAIVLVNLPGPALIEALFPGSLNAERLPTTDAGRALLLAIVFAAGMAGAFVVVLLAPDRPVGHALVYVGVILLIDVLGAVSLRATQPAWFVIGVVAIVPPQAWLGAVLGLRARRRVLRARAGAAGVSATAPIASDPALPLPSGREQR